jgi:hypothetical protein
VRYAGPGCGPMHGIEVEFKSEPPLFDIEVKV